MTGELAEYEAEVEAFVEDRDWGQFHTPKDLAVGLVTEASELLELFRFLQEDDVEARLEDPSFQEQIHDEVGDALFFLVRFAQRMDIDLVEAGRDKLEKSKAKYPADEFRGDNWKVLDDDPSPSST